ncbi:MAG TPA: hypothetical protein VFN53_03525, partial [Acidobacteriaceae bacterium]|nr:hypothetical protein [Acidobacteriaceae bacterium]
IYRLTGMDGESGGALLIRLGHCVCLRGQDEFVAESEKPASYALRVTEAKEWKDFTWSFASPKTAARMRTLAFAWRNTCFGGKNSYLRKY